MYLKNTFVNIADLHGKISTAHQKFQRPTLAVVWERVVYAILLYRQVVNVTVPLTRCIHFSIHLRTKCLHQVTLNVLVLVSMLERRR